MLHLNARNAFNSYLALLAGGAMLLVGGTGCSPQGASSSSGEPALETPADSLAMRVYDYMGGPDAWNSTRHLRFDFAAAMSGTPQSTRRHLWNRKTGAYRLEWPASSGTHVALFNTNNRDEGQVFLNGSAVPAADKDSLLQTAYRSYINDTYWLLAPTKLLDPGAQRSLIADSSTASTAVLHVTFADTVGMTPGDEYWHYIDRRTGRLKAWRFELQGGNRGHFRWKGYRRLQAPAGSVRVATRKQSAGGPLAILTDSVSLPQNVPDSLFSSPQPLLSPVSLE
jgi:hypothetical protein